MALVDLKDAWGWIRRIIHRLERLESGAFLERSSITNGRMRFIGGTLRGDSGATLDWVGLMQVVGSLILTGAIEVNDDGSISLGGVTLTNDNIDVDGSGTITVGGITIDPSANGGTVSFGSGRIVHAGSGYLGMYDGDNFVVFNDGGVTVYAEGRSLRISSLGIRFAGLPTTPLSSAPSGAFVGAVISDGSGYLSRVV